MMDLASDAITYVIPVLITAIAGYLVARRGKGGDTDDSPTPPTPATAAHWQQLVTQMQAWTDKRIAEQDAKIESLSRRVSSLESRYRAALQFIRTLLHRHPENVDEVPPQIHGDL